MITCTAGLQNLKLPDRIWANVGDKRARCQLKIHADSVEAMSAMQQDHKHFLDKFPDISLASGSCYAMQLAETGSI
jgi:hypothetical protein